MPINLSRDKMKVVACQNCGAKYQLDDDDDISAFECSVCSGNLKELDALPQENVSSDNDSQEFSESVLVYCTNCGLKYQLSQDDNINEFECNSCGGSLDYVSNMDSASNDSTTQTIFMGNPLTEDDTEIDEIIPIHADPNYDGEIDEIIPIHAEVQDDDYDVYYETEVVSDDMLESPYGEELIPYGSIYDSSLGETDEIIPIHAEKRHMETSRNIASGFGYADYPDEESEDEGERLVEITDIPEDEMPESPVSLSRQELSEEDQKLFARVQNEMVFDSPEEYEAFKLARYKYYVALTDNLKDDYIQSMDKEYYKKNPVKRLIQKGEKSVKQGNLTAGEDDALITKETVELMKAQNRAYEPKKTYADVYILIGAFILVVSAAYYFFISRLWYTLIAVVLGVLILSFGLYKRYAFNNYIARGRIIRERLLALPNPKLYG